MEVKEAIKRPQHVLKVTCSNITEENKIRHKGIMNKARTVVSKAMREKAEEGLTLTKNV